MPVCRQAAPRAVPFRHARRLACAAAAALALAVGTAPTPVAQASSDPCAIETAERVVAIGDVHGAYDRFVDTLERTGLTDRRGRWIGGRAVFVQTGDLVDRGPDSRRVLDLLRRLERDASRAGGQVHVLLGNHEVMRMTGDWRYVTDAEYAAFRDAGSADLRERAYAVVADRAAREARATDTPHDAAAFRKQFLQDVPLGFVEMRIAFEADGDYGRWLRAHHAVAKINGVLFLHGGVSEETAGLGCQGINEAVRREITADEMPPPEALTRAEHGPLWYRGLADEPEDEFSPVVDRILDQIGARAIVVGHTPVRGGIATRFGGRVVLLDTGMLGGESYPGGVPAALEIQGDVVTAIYPDRRERLAVPTPRGG